MPLSLSNLKPARGSRKKAKRIGRGNASGHGTYSGRGVKGQKARSGGKGGLKRLGMRRLILSFPKVGGFRSLRLKPVIVNINDLEQVFPSGAEVSPKTLLKVGLIRASAAGVKILGDGKLTKKLTVKGCAVSESAKKKILDAGGEVNG